MKNIEKTHKERRGKSLSLVLTAPGRKSLWQGYGDLILQLLEVNIYLKKEMHMTNAPKEEGWRMS
jgi:hypothetical protein